MIPFKIIRKFISIIDPIKICPEEESNNIYIDLEKRFLIHGMNIMFLACMFEKIINIDGKGAHSIIWRFI